MTVSPPTRFSHSPLPATAALIVCDAAATWSVAWRRELGPVCPLIEVPTLAQAGTALAEYPHGALALAWREQAAPAQIEFLARMQHQLPHVLGIAMLQAADHAWELLLREAGVRWVLYTQRDVLAAAPLVQKHFARAPQPKLSLRERVWRQLPWDAVRDNATEHP